MTFKVKRSKKLPASYWEERELKTLREKYKHKFPPFPVITRAGTRHIAKIDKSIHRKGNVVDYKNKVVRINKVSRKGIWVTPLKKSNGIAEPTKKSIFIPEKKVRKEVYPIFLGIAI